MEKDLPGPEDDLPPLSPYARSKFELELRALEYGRSPEEQYKAETEALGNNVVLSGEVRRADMTRLQRVVGWIFDKIARL